PPAQSSPLSLPDALPISGTRSATSSEWETSRPSPAPPTPTPTTSTDPAPPPPAHVVGIENVRAARQRPIAGPGAGAAVPGSAARDRKSTRLNSSHSQISY